MNLTGNITASGSDGEAELEHSQSQSLRRTGRGGARRGHRKRVVQELDSSSGPVDPWNEVTHQVGLAREALEGRWKKKIERQEKLVKELEETLDKINKEITKFDEMHQKEVARNTKLVVLVEDIEAKLHSITSSKPKSNAS